MYFRTTSDHWNLQTKSSPFRHFDMLIAQIGADLGYRQSISGGQQNWRFILPI